VVVYRLYGDEGSLDIAILLLPSIVSINLINFCASMRLILPCFWPFPNLCENAAS
jgi:hypothetical protein